MENVVLYYSLTGKSGTKALEFAAATDKGAVRVETPKKLSMFKAFVVGCPKAIAGRPMEIVPLGKLGATHADVFAPIWAGGIAPPMIAGLMTLDKGTKVSLHLTSRSGHGNKAKITKLVETLGLICDGYEDIR